MRRRWAPAGGGKALRWHRGLEPPAEHEACFPWRGVGGLSPRERQHPCAERAHGEPAALTPTREGLLPVWPAVSLGFVTATLVTGGQRAARPVPRCAPPPLSCPHRDTRAQTSHTHLQTPRGRELRDTALDTDISTHRCPPSQTHTGWGCQRPGIYKHRHSDTEPQEHTLWCATHMQHPVTHIQTHVPPLTHTAPCSPFFAQEVEIEGKGLESRPRGCPPLISCLSERRRLRVTGRARAQMAL